MADIRVRHSRSREVVSDRQLVGEGAQQRRVLSAEVAPFQSMGAASRDIFEALSGICKSSVCEYGKFWAIRIDDLPGLVEVY